MSLLQSLPETDRHLLNPVVGRPFRVLWITRVRVAANAWHGFETTLRPWRLRGAIHIPTQFRASTASPFTRPATIPARADDWQGEDHGPPNSGGLMSEVGAAPASSGLAEAVPPQEMGVVAELARVQQSTKSSAGSQPVSLDQSSLMGRPGPLV